MKLVKDFIKKEIPILHKDTPLVEIIKIFSNSEHNILPVVDKDGILTGIVSLEDIIENLLFSKEETILLEKLSFLADLFSESFENFKCVSPLIVAEDIIQANVISVKENDSMLKALILMKKKNVHRVIVVDKNNRPIGYISRNEICKVLIC